MPLVRSTPVSVLLAFAAFAALGPACVSGAAAAATKPHRTAAATAIFVDGLQVRARAVVRRGRVFVPLRGVLQRLGANVRYSGRGRIAVAHGGAVVLTLAVGRRRAVLRGRKYDLGAAPFRAYGRVYIPLRAVAQATGASVTYHAQPTYVSMYSADAALDRSAALANGASALGANVLVASAPLAPETVIAPNVDDEGGTFARVAGAVAIVALLWPAVAYALWRRRVREEPRIVSRAAPRDVR